MYRSALLLVLPLTVFALVGCSGGATEQEVPPAVAAPAPPPANAKPVKKDAVTNTQPDPRL